MSEGNLRWTSIYPGGVAILQVASCYRKRTCFVGYVHLGPAHPLAKPSARQAQNQEDKLAVLATQIGTQFKWLGGREESYDFCI